MTKQCAVCSREFEPKRPEYRTCGATCRNRLISTEKAARHLTTQPCAVCGVLFTNTGAQKGRRACSVECGRKLVGKLLEKKVERICKTCGAHFETVPSAKQEYCSKRCMYARNDTTRECEVCGKPFRSPPSQMHVRTCSPECGYKIRVVPFGVGQTERITYAAGNDANGKALYPRTKAAGNEHNAQRRAAKLQAAVPWADAAKINAIYADAQRISRHTGMIYHVDHMVPLVSKRVGGLHNEFNLQVLPGPDNLRKTNRTWPDMW